MTNSDKERRETNKITRDYRKSVREVNKAKSEALQWSSSTYERREIKEQAQSLIYDLSTRYRQDQNKQGTDERIQNDGIDELEGPKPSGASGNLPDGYVETAVTLCVNGSPVAGKILFKEDP